MCRGGAWRIKGWGLDRLLDLFNSYKTFLQFTEMLLHCQFTHCSLRWNAPQLHSFWSGLPSNLLACIVDAIVLATALNHPKVSAPAAPSLRLLIQSSSLMRFQPIQCTDQIFLWGQNFGSHRYLQAPLSPAVMLVEVFSFLERLNLPNCTVPHFCILMESSTIHFATCSPGVPDGLIECLPASHTQLLFPAFIPYVVIAFLMRLSSLFHDCSLF
jgi:hypothetical protein